jgi:putative membrane protein
MIVYNPNERWSKHLKHLFTSFTMTRVVRSSLIFGAFTAFLAFIHPQFIPAESVEGFAGIFTFLGVVLSILMVFRTNAAYDRWWEGRKQWGMLLIQCRSLATYIHTMYDVGDTESRRYYSVGISNFCLAMVEHLRQGTIVEKLIPYSETETIKLKASDHVPNIIARELFQKLEIDYRLGTIQDMDILNVRPAHHAMMEVLGACERIKATPIPFGHAVLVKMFIAAYGILLPFALVPELGYWSIPAIMIIMFAFLGVEMLGAEIEDPFGLDCNDLPTQTIAEKIRDNVHEILEVNPNYEPSKPAELYDKVF